MRALTWVAALVFFLSVGATTLLLVDPYTVERLVENWPPLPKEARAEKVISLVKTNWLFYGTVALFSGFAWAGLFRARRPKRFRRSTPPVAARGNPRPASDEIPAPAVSSPGSSPGVEELLSQFETHWKSFAHHTEDLLHRKIQELDGGQKGIKDLSEKVSVLGRALEEIRKDISELRDDARGAKASVKDAAPSKEAGELKKLHAEMRAALDRLSGLDERGLKLVKVIEDERQNALAKLLQEESRKLEGNWSGKVSTLTAQVEEARREAGTLRAELVKERESQAALGRELEQRVARGKKLESDLETAAREKAKRAEEAKETTSQLDRARKEIEKREREFAEERRRLCGKVEELETQGTLLESEKADAESTSSRLQSLLDTDGVEREKLRVAAETARAAKERVEAEARRLAEELKALRTERAQAKAREVVSLGEEKARLERELEAVRAELAAEREARPRADQESTGAAPEPAAATGPGLEELGLELAEARAQAASREDRNRALEVEVAELRKQILDREAEIARLEDGDQAPRTANASADSALLAYRAEIERLELARFDEARRAQALDEEARKFKARLAELEKVRQHDDEPAAAPDEPARLKELERERVDLLSSLDRLGGELDKLRGDIEGFRRFQGALIDGSIPAAISGVDTALKIFAWNPAAEGLWKIEAESVLGRRLPELALAGFGPEVLAEVERAMREKQTVTPPRSTFIDGGGKVRHVEWSFDPILGPGDESLGAVLIANDVTEKVEQEIEARVQALFSQSLLRSLPSALIVLDVERRVISWNLGAERLLGMTEGEVVGREFFTLPVPLAKPAFQKRFEESERDSSVHRLRVRFDHEGATGNFVVTQAPFVGNDESIRGSMLIIESLAVPVAAK